MFKCVLKLTVRWFFSDLKAMAKVTSAILILRKGGSTQWTTDLDNQLIAWTKEYITWLETAEIAIEEALATKYVFYFMFPSSMLKISQQPRYLLL